MRVPLFFLLAATACLQPTEVDRAERVPATEEVQSFGSLQTRFGRIDTFLSPSGPLYSVTSRDGSVLAERVDEETLAVLVPEAHAIVDAAVADGSRLGLLGY